MLVDADGTCACAAGPFSRSVEARMEGFGCKYLIVHFARVHSTPSESLMCAAALCHRTT